MKGFFIVVIISCIVITFAYILRFFNKKNIKPQPKKREKVDIPFKDIIIKLKKRR